MKFMITNPSNFGCHDQEYYLHGAEPHSMTFMFDPPLPKSLIHIVAPSTFESIAHMPRPLPPRRSRALPNRPPYDARAPIHLRTAPASACCALRPRRTTPLCSARAGWTWASPQPRPDASAPYRIRHTGPLVGTALPVRALSSPAPAGLRRRSCRRLSLPVATQPRHPRRL